MNKPKRRDYKLSQKIKKRTKLLNRVLFLKKIHKMDEEFVLLDKKYWPDRDALRFNCLNCKHNHVVESPNKCPKYDPINIRIMPGAGLRKDSCWWVCYGHKFKGE